ncbi:MAG: peptidylprolyl isomerase [Proteobacteria bacterium]|nr:peptidylprolyl isomerase [Pseudomonadota bacterium]
MRREAEWVFGDGSPGFCAPSACGGQQDCHDRTRKGPKTDAPSTVKNFEAKANQGFYNGLKFHRVEDWVVQGGDPKGDGTGGGQINSEYNEREFRVGAVGIARRDDPRLNNDSQFFIVKRDSPHLNKQYTNFGQVTGGLELVVKIAIGDKIKKITVK